VLRRNVGTKQNTYVKHAHVPTHTTHCLYQKLLLPTWHRRSSSCSIQRFPTLVNIGHDRASPPWMFAACHPLTMTPPPPPYMCLHRNQEPGRQPSDKRHPQPRTSVMLPNFTTLPSNSESITSCRSTHRRADDIIVAKWPIMAPALHFSARWYKIQCVRPYVIATSFPKLYGTIKQRSKCGRSQACTVDDGTYTTNTW